MRTTTVIGPETPDQYLSLRCNVISPLIRSTVSTLYRFADTGMPAFMAAGPAAGGVLEQVGRQQVGEQCPPVGERRAELDVDHLAALPAAHVRDQAVARGVDRAGRRGHLGGQVTEIIAGDRGAVRP